MSLPPPAPAEPTAAARLPRDAGDLALVAAALCVGESTIENLPPDDQTGALIEALRGLGAHIHGENRTLRIRGVGVGGLSRPDGPLPALDGPGLCALLGALAGHAMETRIQLGAAVTTDVVEALCGPLAAAGATLVRDSRTIRLVGACDPLPLAVDPGGAHAVPLATAALFAGLHAAGTTRVPDEKGAAAIDVIRAFGAELTAAGTGLLALRGLPELAPCTIVLPVEERRHP